AMLTWFISPWIFMGTTIGVVLILYRREFHSDVLDVMVFTPTESAPIDAAKESSIASTETINP
ncbi:MAG: DUF599 family protein, partial [Gammaproteobacteria bacterium]